MACQFLESIVPQQYLYRAAEAKKIFSVGDQSPKTLASAIALAELVQLIVFVAQTVLYSLAFFGVIPPQAAGIGALILIPVAAYCSYQTFVHYKTASRLLLTAAAVATLLMCAGCALFGMVTDSAITLCVGGIVLHVFRNLSEYFDTKTALKDPEYKRQMLPNS